MNLFKTLSGIYFTAEDFVCYYRRPEQTRQGNNRVTYQGRRIIWMLSNSPNRKGLWLLDSASDNFWGAVVIHVTSDCLVIYGAYVSL